MAIIDSPDSFQIGRVVSRLSGVLERNFATVASLTLVVMLPELLAMLMAPEALGGSAVTIVGAICKYALQAALVQATITDLNGERPSFRACAATGAREFLPILGIAVASSFGVIFGLILLVVPGIIWLVSWSVAVPVRVVEQTRIMAALGRSAELTKGYRWNIFALLLMYVLLLVVSLLPLILLLMLGGREMLEGSILYQFLTWVWESAFGVVGAAGIASVYYELRLVKEGMGAEQLAEAFE